MGEGGQRGEKEEEGASRRKDFYRKAGAVRLYVKSSRLLRETVGCVPESRGKLCVMIGSLPEEVRTFGGPQVAPEAAAATGGSAADYHISSQFAHN